MSQETISIFEEPREETFFSRTWDRWAEVLIIPVIIIALFAFRNWYGEKEAQDADRLHARLANMHQTVTKQARFTGDATPTGSFVASFPYGLYLETEDGSGWTIKVPIEMKSAGTDAGAIRVAVGTVKVHEVIGGYELVAFETITPAGRDLELAKKKLAESRSGKLWYAPEPPK